MPTYEYKCESCGYTFEKFQSIKDKPVSKIKHIKSSKLMKRI